MRSCLLILAMLPWVLSAQISRVSATPSPEVLALSADGTELHFFSTLVLRGEEARTANTSRIYRYRQGRPEIVREASGGQDFSAPFLSTDGQVRAEFCSQVQPFFRPIFWDGACITREGQSTYYRGDLSRISRNGRFLFQGASLRDLESGQLYLLTGNPRPLHPHNALSDNGTLITYYLPTDVDTSKNLGIALSRPDEPQRLIYQGGYVSMAAISADGRYAFVRAESAQGILSLIEIDLASNAQRTIFETDKDLFQFSLDANASHILIHYYQALSLWDRASNEVRRIADSPDLIRSAVICDDGSTVAYQRNDASLHRLSTASGESEVLYDASPAAMLTNFRTAYPGSAVFFSTRGLLPDAEIRINGFQVPVLRLETTSIEAQTLLIQIPWDQPIPTGSGRISVTQSGSPFVLLHDLPFLQAPTPGFFSYFDNDARGFVVSAALEDFSSLASRANPAPAGSTIHAYLGGLGPLDQPISTGQPGPANPPAKPLATITCELRNLDSNGPFRTLEIPTLIYAPGLVGAYQADLKIPSDWPSAYNQLRCRNATGALDETRLYTKAR